jgi:hypothetical protein
MLSTMSQNDTEALKHETGGAKLEGSEARILELLVQA